MTTIKRVQEACKAAPHYRVKCGDLEVVGTKSLTRWEFGYSVRRQREDGRTRVSLGKRNAIAYLESLQEDTPIVALAYDAPGNVGNGDTAKTIVARDTMIEMSRLRSAELRERVNAMCEKRGWRLMREAMHETLSGWTGEAHRQTHVAEALRRVEFVKATQTDDARTAWRIAYHCARLARFDIKLAKARLLSEASHD